MADKDGWIDRMRTLLGPEGIDLSADRRALFAQDVFSATAPVRAIVSPKSTEQIAAVIRIAAEHGLHVVPRGGGVSYTSGYLSEDPAAAIVLDLHAMDRIIAISVEDMYVVVEPGCTWEALHIALAPLGLRGAFWGTISGQRATIGGSVSQNAFFWGAGIAGSLSESVLAVEVVTGSGAIIRTGSFGVTGANPFFRHFGPDLTGVFTADAGALGIKTQIVLRLVPIAAATDALSFALPDHEAMTGFMSDVARQGLAAQQMGLDARIKTARLASDGWLADLGHLWRLVRGAPSLGKGIANALRVIRAGRDFIGDSPFSAHIFLEGRDARDVAAIADRVRAIAAEHRATPVEASIPRMMLASPFGPLNGMLGPKGERWVPVHCVVPHSVAPRAYEAIAAVLQANDALLKRHDIDTGYLFTTAGVNGFVIEPMFLWPDALHALHHDVIDAGRLARYPARPDAMDARAAVVKMRGAITAAVDALGAVHIQLGRYYAYAERIDPGAAAMVRDLRTALDPSGVINPGALRGVPKNT